MIQLRAPFSYFGGKRSIVDLVWSRFGRVKSYSEPFAGSLAMLWGAPRVHSLEIIGDQNCYVANHWRVTKYQPDVLVEHADYPVVHIDLTARHRWLVEPNRVADLHAKLMDPEWPGDAQIAGWWVWGLSTWIGSGWCGKGASWEQVPEYSHAGKGIHSLSMRDNVHGAYRALSARLQHVRVINGDWTRCLNTHYGRHHDGTAAMFLDPPYKAYEKLYRESEPVASAVEEWCREQTDVPRFRMALCGHVGDYDLLGWDCVLWSRDSMTYGSNKTKVREAVWFSPQCLPPEPVQRSLF